jgi:putative PIN family toxin of toxin-antitoxin system
VLKVTADTNVYVSALNFGGKPQRVLELARARRIELAISNAIVTELQRILYNKFHWSKPDLDEALDQILGFARYVHPEVTFDAVPSDPDDNRVLECASKAESDMIVTGDTDLLVLQFHAGRQILTPAEFMATWRRQSRQP